MPVERSVFMRSVYFLLFGLVAFSVSVSGQEAPEQLTTEDIIEMVQAGISDRLILQKISISTLLYEPSVQDILNLKKAGASDRIIEALMGVTSPTPTRATSTAQLPESGWEFQLEPMWMDVGGWNEHVGDIVNASFTTIVGPPGVASDIRDRRPVNLDLDAGFAFRGSVTYEYQQWGVGAAGWFFGTDDSLSGTVTTPVPTADTFFRNFVSFWGEPRGPVTNELEPSGIAPEEFRVDQELDTFTAEVFGFRTLAENSSSRIDAIVGVKVGQLETTQNQSINLRSFLFDGFGPGLHFNNFISLSSTAEAEFLGVGPMVGFSGRATWRQLAFHTFVTQSLLIGDADLEGQFTDIDDISSTPDPAGPFTPFLLIRSDLPFSRSEKAFIPVTEFQLVAEWHITRILAVGATGFAAIWFDAPVAPTFSFPTVSTVPFPGQWTVEKRTLGFVGVGLKLEARF